MANLNGIQKKDFEKLAEYLGKEKALEYIRNKEYNYRAVSTKLLLLDLNDYIKRKPFVFWTLLILVVLILGYHIFDTLHY